MNDLEAMQGQGNLNESVDVERLAREVAANDWASILMWMKGFIALYDFEDEYIGGLSAMLLPWLETSLEKQFREKTGLIR